MKIQCNYDYITRVWFYISAGVTFNNYKVRVQLQKGATATSYEPYGKYKIPVKVGRNNLVNYKDVEGTSNTSVLLIDNGFNVVGNYAGKIMNIKVTPNTDYYLSYNTENIIGTRKVVKIFPNSSTNTNIATFTNGTGGTFNSGENDIIQIWFYAASGSDGEANFTNIQLEKGTTATSYVSGPTTENIYLDEPLRKVGSYVDYIDFENKKIYRNVGETIFKGGESWRTELFGDNNLYYIVISDMISGTRQEFISNLFSTSKSGSSNVQPNNSIAFGYSNNFIYIRYNSVANSEAFKTFLTNKNLQVIYGLSGNLVAQRINNLELPEILKQDGYNIIGISTTVEPSNIIYSYSN